MASQHQYDIDAVIPAGIGSTYDIVHNIQGKCHLTPDPGETIQDQFTVLGKALIPGTAFHAVWVNGNVLRLVNDGVGVCIAKMHIEHRHSLKQ